LVHILAKRSSSGGNSFMDFHGNKFNFLVHLQLKIYLNLQNSVVPTPIMALPDQKLVVPRHYRHIVLRRLWSTVKHIVKFTVQSAKCYSSSA